MVENELLDPDASAESVPDTSKRKRYRFSYAKKHFHAESALCLRADPALPQPELMPELLGQIIACPSKKEQLRIPGEMDSSEERQSGFSRHLRTSFPMDVLHPQLAYLIGGVYRRARPAMSMRTI